MCRVRFVNSKTFRQGCYVVDVRFTLKTRRVLTNFVESYMNIKEKNIPLQMAVRILPVKQKNDIYI